MTAYRTRQPVLILEGQDAAILMQVGRLHDARLRLRGRDERAYRLLLAVHETALEWRASADGKPAVTGAASREPSNWVTPNDVAQQLNVTPRTIRNDIAGGILPATKKDRVWIIDALDAITYISARNSE